MSKGAKILTKKSILIFLILLLFEASCLSQETDTSLSKHVLDNGLTVIIKEEHSNPIVSVLATVDAGLSSEGAYTGTGISHFVEHTLFKGTSKRKPGEIEEEVKSFGGTINAWTGLDSTTYAVTVPKEHAGEALDLTEDIVFHPAFEAREVEKEREVILKEIKLNNDDPSRRVMRQLWETAYLKHPYKIPIIGYEGLFKGLNRGDLVKYHSLRYTPGNIVLVVVGDIDKDEALSRIKKTFGKNERKRDSVAFVPLEPPQNSPRILKGHAQINLGYLAMGFHTVALSDRDVYALDVLGIILGDWDGSRLNRKLVKDERLLYTVGAFNYTPKYPGLFIVYGVGDYERLEKAKKEILNEIKKIAQDGAEESELEAAKNIVVSGYIDLLETTGGLARAVSQSEFLAGDPSFFEKYVGNVKKVDNNAVRRAARKYLAEKNLTVSYLLPMSRAETGARAGTGSSSGSIVSGQNLSPRRVSRPVPTEPTKVVLPNGIRLILKENPRLPKVSVVCVFLGGLMAETKENNGISGLTSAMLLKGTKKRSESQIKAFLESRGGKISHFSGKNSLGVFLESLSENTSESLDVLSDIILNPVFPEEEIEKQKEKIYAAIKAEDDDVYSTGFLKLRKAVFENYPYGMRVLGEPGSVERITKKDIQNFYRKFAVAGNMVVAVVGDFQAQSMPREIEKRFSALERGTFDIKTTKPAPLSGVKKVTCDMPREQSLVLVGFRGATFEGKDRYGLSLLSSVLSGENGRLYKAIRNELGLSYALGVFSVPGIDTGFIVSYAATDEKNLEKAKNILFRELEKAGKGVVPEEEINLAKTSLIGRQKIFLQTNTALARKMALDELYGMGYDAYEKYPQQIQGVGQEAIADVSEKYIDLNRSCVVTIYGRKGASDE
ncbi:MAG: pitrilysin family protein [Candidatus Omnitrophota bacterium]